MKTKDIWKLEKDKRLAAFLDRYLELDEFTGNRTAEEKQEMAEIADAVLPTMIRFVAQIKSLTEKWRPHARSTEEELKSFGEGQRGAVQVAATYGICLAQVGLLVEKLEGKQG